MVWKYNKHNLNEECSCVFYKYRLLDFFFIVVQTLISVSKHIILREKRAYVKVRCENY